MSWLLKPFAAEEPPMNMALDEALLDFAIEHKSPVMRLYGWTTPAATFGYSQKFEAVSKMTLLRPLIRRATGGGLVPHDADWTYSLTFPPGNSWYLLAAKDSYNQIHQWVQSSFRLLGLESELCSAARKEIPGQCFVGSEKSDVLWHGKKIAGAAQRRNKKGLLIQGSIQPPPLNLSRPKWEEAFLSIRSDWEVFQPNSKFSDHVELLKIKYESLGYNQGR